MTVAELIKFLQTQPKNIRVAYQKWSEQVLMEESNIDIVKLCKARPDGWIQNSRPDMETEEYLLFPGN